MNRTSSALALFLALATGACATPSAPERAAAACEYAEDYGATLTALANEIDFTCETLGALRANAVDPRGTNKETLETFERGVKNLAVQLERARKDYAKMDARAHAFLATWGTDTVTLRDGNLAREAETRRGTLQASFETLAREDLAVQQRVERYRLELADLATYLANDLSPRGFAGAQAAIERAFQGGSSLRAELALLATKVEAVRAELEPLRGPGSTEPAATAGAN
ncbi:MAG: hypothetical protein ABL998_09335 [Planctomycetota bacterium]